MKNRINLYTREFRPYLEVLTFDNILVSCLLVLFVLFAIRFYYDAEDAELSQQKIRLQSMVDRQTSLVKSLQQQLESRGQDPRLVAQVEIDQAELALKQRLLNEVRGRELLKTQGFSNLMLDLARAHNPDVWLTNIRVNQQDMRFEGQTTDSAAVPKWVENLGRANYFNGRDFAATRMYSTDDKIHFVLSSSLADAQAQEVINE